MNTTISTNCAGATPISCDTITSTASRRTLSSRWTRLSLHIVIWRWLWCTAQRPEPVEAVLRPMVEIIHGIENQQINDEVDPGLVGDARATLIDLQRGQSPDARLPEGCIPNWLHQKNSATPEQAKPVG